MFDGFHREGHILLGSSKIKLFEKETSPELTVEVNTPWKMEVILSCHLTSFFFQNGRRVFGTIPSFLSADLFQDKDSDFSRETSCRVSKDAYA